MVISNAFFVLSWFKQFRVDFREFLRDRFIKIYTAIYLCKNQKKIEKDSGIYEKLA
jgi:hypothetical protein